MIGETHDNFVKQSEKVFKSKISQEKKIQKIINIWIIQHYKVILKSPNPNVWLDMLKNSPESEKRFRRLFINSMTPLLGDDLAEVIVLSFRGLLDDRPKIRTLEKRIKVLISILGR
jgi:hypothetical protein